MPYANEHAARVRNPARFARIRPKQLKAGLRMLGGPLKGGTGEWVVQAYRFNRRYFTSAEAKAWLRSHKVKVILFEPATGG
jgi:hypothetical protein